MLSYLRAQLWDVRRGAPALLVLRAAGQDSGQDGPRAHVQLIIKVPSALQTSACKRKQRPLQQRKSPITLGFLKLTYSAGPLADPAVDIDLEGERESERDAERVLTKKSTGFRVALRYELSWRVGLSGVSRLKRSRASRLRSKAVVDPR